MRTKAVRGFTLVEILVVLIIAGAVSGILIQALAQIYRLQERFGQQLAESQDGAMRADWFRQVLQGLQTDFPLGKQLFSGKADGLQGLSVSPLSVEPGAVQEVSVRLDYRAAEARTVVVYEAGEVRSVLFSWPGRRGGFAYLDAQGQEHPQWPPVSLGSWPQLPSVVLLKMPSESGLLALAAVPRGTNEPKRRVFQMGVTP